MRHFACLISALIISLSLLTGPVFAKQIDPPSLHFDTGIKALRARTQSVRFEQVQFVFDAGRVLDSDWGRIKVKFPAKSRDCSGYVNVFLENDGRTGDRYSWVVENMHIPPSFHCRGSCPGPGHHAKEEDPEAETRIPETLRHKSRSNSPENNNHNFPITRFFDLRPEEVGTGKVTDIKAIVLVSKRPLPNTDEVWRMLTRHRARMFPVKPAVYNAEGDDGEVDTLGTAAADTIFPPESLTYHLVGTPPPPTFPPFEPELDLAAPIEIFQDTWPNTDAGENQCVPMAHANAFRYLETQFNILPLQWNIPHYAIRGLGIVDAAGDVVFWTAVPDNSVIAHVDQKTKRLFVQDFETGNGSNRCQNIRGAFSYIEEWGGNIARVQFRHQGGSDFYGFGDNNCGDYSPEQIGDYESHREGPVPTWQWIFDQLQAGRSVVISYGRYDSDGKRTGGHMLRIYGASKFNGKAYLYGLDDGNQGDNNNGAQYPVFEVADTENSGEDGDGKTDDMLNIDGKSWEIEFALSTEALPNLLIP